MVTSPERRRCPVCNESGPGPAFVAYERMFGTRDEFQYIECAVCGSLYLLEVPDLQGYYPRGYYAFVSARTGYLRRFIAWLRGFRTFAAWSRLVGTLNPNASILDVGAGSGELLETLSRRGYHDVTGLDPFLEDDSATSPVRILKQPVEAISGAWDLIMFNHSLEHVLEPRKSVAAALSLLRTPESLLLIRIPVVNDAWRRYGIDWVQLDAPRHTFVPTELGLRRLVENAGASIERVVYDSGPLQFWGSERYRAGRNLDDVTRSPLAAVIQGIFGELRYGTYARALNHERRGDQAAFIIRRPA